MTTAPRKTAINDYKDRKTVPGIYAIRCLPEGLVWVGRAPDVATIQNRLWFSLRMGQSTHPALQAAWARHGAEAFRFEIVEELAHDLSAYARQTALKDRQTHWLAQLGASAI